MGVKDYILIGVIVTLAIIAILFIVKNRHNHCGHSNCQGCPNSQICNNKKREKKKDRK